MYPLDCCGMPYGSYVDASSKMASVKVYCKSWLCHSSGNHDDGQCQHPHTTGGLGEETDDVSSFRVFAPYVLVVFSTKSTDATNTVPTLVSFGLFASIAEK